VHPRPDQRHIRDDDVEAIGRYVNNHAGFEFNIEGFPDARLFHIISRVRPDQVTLVPDPPHALTSDRGWVFDDTERELVRSFIEDATGYVERFSVFLDPQEDHVAEADELGADRIEIYTGKFAEHFRAGSHEAALDACSRLAARAKSFGLGVNAGHDLNCRNLTALLDAVPAIDELSIGHELIADALLSGFSATVARYVEVINSTAGVPLVSRSHDVGI